MVDHDQKGVKTVRKGKIGDKIAGDLLEGARAGGGNREERGSRRMGVNFVLLARCAAADIAANVRGEARPPKLRGDQLASFENARMARCGMVVVARDDGAAQVCIGRDIDAALVSQDSSVVVPIGKAGAKSGRDRTRKSMEGVKDQWVRSGGGAKFVGKGGVDEVNKECVWEQGNCLIVCVGSGNMIRTAG